MNTTRTTSESSGSDIVIYTDGGCHNESGTLKGVGAWAFVVYDGNTDNVDVHCGIVRNTTNNRTEMLAIINAIRHHDEHSDITIISDSGYVVKGYNHPSYLDAWMKNNWRTSSGSEVLNRDLWNEIIALTYRYGIKFKLIRGHYKDPDRTHAFWNAIVDRACTFVMQNDIDTDHIIMEFNMKTKKFTMKHLNVELCELKGVKKL